MDLISHRESFNSRFNIKEPELSDEDILRELKKRILGNLKFPGSLNVRAYSVIDKFLSAKGRLLFNQITGAERLFSSTRDAMNNEKTAFSYLSEASSLEDFLLTIEILSKLPFSKPRYKVNFIKMIENAVQFTPKINIRMTQNKEGEIIFYPKGEQFLDENLINKTLSFLDTKSNHHFEDAIREYQNRKSIKSGESSRRTLEEFLRYKMKNKKGLQFNIQELQKPIKEKVSSPELRNIIFQNLKFLDNFFNKSTKHNDGIISENDNEFSSLPNSYSYELYQ